MIANWIGNEKWTLEMDWYGKEKFNDQPLVDWNVEGDAVGKKREFGGLTFATIFGAGHLVCHSHDLLFLLISYIHVGATR